MLGRAFAYPIPDSCGLNKMCGYLAGNFMSINQYSSFFRHENRLYHHPILIGARRFLLYSTHLIMFSIVVERYLMVYAADCPIQLIITLWYNYL